MGKFMLIQPRKPARGARLRRNWRVNTKPIGVLDCPMNGIKIAKPNMPAISEICRNRPSRQMKSMWPFNCLANTDRAIY